MTEQSEMDFTPRAAPEFRAAPMRFDGETYEPEKDRDRLTGQLERVARVMGSGRWMTLRALSEAAAAPEASVSARLRDMRKPRFGGHTVERRRVDGGGEWEYRLT